MANLYGYSGKILRINLTTSYAKSEPLSEADVKMYLGGVGFGAKTLYEELGKNTNPLSPQNKILFTTGILTGTNAPGSGSIDLCFKSPLTGIWAESRSGSDWGLALKKAGYDVLIIEGRAKKPTYIVIEDDEIHIEPADELIGLSSYEKTSLLKEKLGKEFEIANIGPAGENLVYYASVMFGDGSRAAGRSGAGAVLGSKNLYAIAVKGSGEIPIKDKKKFYQTIRKYAQKLLSNPDNISTRENGTVGGMGTCDEVGDWPTKNWRSNSWGKADKIYEHFKEENLVKANGCYKGCILFCERIVEVKEGKWKTPVHSGAEYESITAFTSFIFNEDTDAAVHATYLCNKYGLDTISTGATIAFAMECYENGILTKEDLEGLELTWGNMDAVIPLIHKIAKREGIGNLLADGVRAASLKLGDKTEEYAIHVKGLEGPAHDPRAGKSLALGYGVGNTGMNHIHPLETVAYDTHKMDLGLISYGLTDPHKVDRFSEKGKGYQAKILHDFGVIPDIIGICKFYLYGGLTPDDMADIISSLGWEINGKELLEIGERVINLQRMFNVREGIRKKDDMIPERIKKVPEFGKYKDMEEVKIKDYETMLSEYYEARGWDEEGVPKREKLEKLGLLWTLENA